MAPASIPPLRRIYLYLSGCCNLACRHCWIDPLPAPPADGWLPLTTMQRIIAEAVALGLASVKLTGGEPLLHPQALALAQWLHAAGLGVSLETNATLIGTPQAAALAAARAEVAVSLDGPNAATHEALRATPGSFAAAVAGVRALAAAGVRFQIVSCLYRANREALMGMPRLARELGAASLKINPIAALSRSTAMCERGELLSAAETLQTCEPLRTEAAAQGIPLEFDVPPAFAPIAQLRRTGVCTCAVRTILGVLHNGHASICGIGQVVPELDMGDLTQLSVRRVWEGAPLLQRVRAMVPDGLGGVCGRCLLRRYCQGKCLAHDYACTGRMFGGHAFCAEALRAGVFPASRLLAAAAPAAEARA